METIILSLILVVSSATSIIITYLFLSKQSKRENHALQLELKKSRQDFFLPNRVEAYQRFVLLMERISPNSLVMRLHNNNQSKNEFQAELLKTIRSEFEHNIAQQLFISPKTWEITKNAKEETIKLINLAASQLDDDTTSTALASKVFEITSEMKSIPTEAAILSLKMELQELF